jgi:PAS domain S-box-containing protein
LDALDTSDTSIKAVKAIKAIKAIKAVKTIDVDKVKQDLLNVVHDLQVHQIDLQMQNDELRRTELLLQEGRDRYFELYDLAPVGYATLNSQGKMLEVNLTTTTLLGGTRNTLIGAPLPAFVREEDVDVFHQFLRQVFTSRQRRRCRLVLTTRDGRRLPVQLDASSDADENGKPAACRCTITDLSELFDAQTKGRNVLDTAVDAILGVDDRATIESINRAAEELFGYTEKELIGKSLRVLLPDRGASLWRLVGVDSAARRVMGARKDGSTLPLEVSIGEWREQGARKFTLVLRDLTQSEDAQRKLDESEERFLQIAERIGDVLYVIERNGRFSYVSPAYAVLWGQRGADLLQNPSARIDAVHPEDRARVDAAWHALGMGATFDEEYRILRPDGGTRWVRDRAFPVKDALGVVDRIVGVAHDVTHERSLADELHQAQKMEAVGALVSGVAHDFNNVLQAILGASALAMKESTQPERARQYMQKVAEAAKRGGELAAQLLAFSRKQTVDLKPLALDAALEAISSLLARLLGEHIELVVHHGAPEAVIFADAVQLEQIVMNLASNARDAMPSGGSFTIQTDEIVFGEVTAKRFGLSAPGRYARIIARDTGCGMEEAVRARIFEPFFTTKAIGQGTGLGLSTVFGLTHQLGGHVDVQSAKGEGTVFTFYFPCRERITLRPPPGPGEKGEGRLRGTILMVEDEPLVRMTIVHYLQELGLEVLEAENPDSALRLSETHAGPVDVLVSDVMMPGMTGPRLARLLRDRRTTMRTLLISAHPKRMLLERGTLEEDVPVLQKPFTQGELGDALRRVLRAKSG